MTRPGPTSTGGGPAGAAPTPVAWAEVRVELERVAARIPPLFAAVRDPAAPGLGVWNIAELATHLSHPWRGLPALARGDLATLIQAAPPGSREGLGTPSGAMFADIAMLAPWTKVAVAADPERDLGRLAAQIQDCAAQFVATDHDVDPSPRPWIVDGIRVPPATFGCHVLNESLTHGHDIARAAGGLPWPIEPAAAALVVRGFLLVVLSAAMSLAPEVGPRFRIDVQLIGDRRFSVVKDAAGMRLEQTSGRPVDAHLRTDPVSMLLMIWKRRSLVSLVGRGKLLVWGRRPWKALELLSLVPDV